MSNKKRKIDGYMGVSVHAYKGGELGGVSTDKTMAGVLWDMEIVEYLEVEEMDYKNGVYVVTKVFDTKEKLWDEFYKTVCDALKPIYAGAEYVCYSFFEMRGIHVYSADVTDDDIKDYFKIHWNNYLKDELNKYNEKKNKDNEKRS